MGAEEQMTDSWPGAGALDTGTDDLLAAVDDGVATIVLNRPARRNALSPEMLAALARVLERLDGADDVGALVITGSGPAFCAGGDVKGFSERGGEGGTAGVADPAAIAEQQGIQRATVGALHAFAQPVIAALPGAAAGAGLGFALAADLRIGTPRTVLTTAFARVGLSGDYGTAWLLRQLVGPARAAELMFLSDRVDADAALRLGLLNWVVAADELRPRTAELAARLARGPRLALASMKRNLLLAGQAGLGEAMDAEVPRHKECGVTDDHREAVAAFVEKREPRFGAAR
jgi:2-(1,2-epoxy-1,2-dihydrophenyl)acetyl-CoA isomerase